MTHGSLFSGIGGFDLAAEWMGWENKFHCEWNPFGQKILKHYWPDAETFTDITKTDFNKYANKIDILTGGFPCQPYSSAGKRLGKADQRHLWPEMLRAIREINPTYIVGENVRGLLNWNGGMVFHEVCAELETNGYEVAPCLIPACGVGAPHRRDRIWFVAYSSTNRKNIRQVSQKKSIRQEFSNESKISNVTNSDAAKNTFSNGCILGEFKQERAEIRKFGNTCTGSKIGFYKPENDVNDNNSYKRTEFSWHQFPTQSAICGGDDGLPSKLDGITFPKWREESIRGYGNAIVPQVALQIFKAIQKYDTENRC